MEYNIQKCSSADKMNMFVDDGSQLKVSFTRVSSGGEAFEGFNRLDNSSKRKAYTSHVRKISTETLLSIGMRGGKMVMMTKRPCADTFRKSWNTQNPVDSLHLHGSTR